MSPEAQRIAIAEACGWQARQCGEHAAFPGMWRIVPPNPSQIVAERFETKEIGLLAYVPDYLNDLNAMAQAVAIAGINDRRWSDALMNVIRDDPTWTAGAVEARYRTAKATAAQRAEAFLRTLGLWKEEE